MGVKEWEEFRMTFRVSGLKCQMDRLPITVRRPILDGRMGLGKNVEFSFECCEFELLMELSGRNVQEVGMCESRCR